MQRPKYLFVGDVALFCLSSSYELAFSLFPAGVKSKLFDVFSSELIMNVCIAYQRMAQTREVVNLKPGISEYFSVKSPKHYRSLSRSYLCHSLDFILQLKMSLLLSVFRSGLSIPWRR